MKWTIKNIFYKQKAEKKEEPEGIFIQEKNTELDEQFAQNFTNNGGRFLFCNDWSDAVSFLQNILTENQWETSSCYQKQLQTKIKTLNLTTSNDNSSEVHLCFCESLIAKKGSIMLSSDHTNGVRISNLPKNFIIFASPNQIVYQLSDGLQMIKKNKSNQLPSNITSITGGKNQSECLANTNLIKNIYLLLIEHFHG